VLPLKCNNEVPLLCCRTTNYFLLLLTMISVKYYECVSVFLFQLSFLRRIILSPVACLAVPYSSTPSKVRFSEKNYWIQNVFYFPYNYCLKYFSFWDEFSEILSRNVPVTLARFKSYLNFLDRFSKNSKVLISRISVQWKPRYFFVDIRMDRHTHTHDEANSHFLQFCEHAQNCNEHCNTLWRIHSYLFMLSTSSTQYSF